VQQVFDKYFGFERNINFWQTTGTQKLPIAPSKKDIKNVADIEENV
jgi:hypothetical protein